MFETQLVHSSCPYCGEAIQLIVDCSEPEQHYIEDCQVCCRPMTINLSLDGQGEPMVNVYDENHA